MSGFFRHALLPFLGNAAYLTINHKPIFGLVLEEAFFIFLQYMKVGISRYVGIFDICL